MAEYSSKKFPTLYDCYYQVGKRCLWISRNLKLQGRFVDDIKQKLSNFKKIWSKFERELSSKMGNNSENSNALLLVMQLGINAESVEQLRDVPAYHTRLICHSFRIIPEKSKLQNLYKFFVLSIQFTFIHKYSINFP